MTILTMETVIDDDIIAACRAAGACAEGLAYVAAHPTVAELRRHNLAWFYWLVLNVNFSGADLRGADLSWADLHEANLREANLREAKNLTVTQLATAWGVSDEQMNIVPAVPDAR